MSQMQGKELQCLNGGSENDVGAEVYREAVMHKGKVPWNIIKLQRAMWLSATEVSGE